MKKHSFPEQLLLDGSTQQQKLLDDAIEKVRAVHDMLGGAKIYGCFSGGKDSTALKIVMRLAAEKDNVPLNEYCDFHYNITGVDPPELYRFIKEYHPDVHMEMYEESMWSLIRRKGPPTRLRRFCCAKLKEHGGYGRYCATGVRWEESNNRAKYRAAFEVLGSSKQKVFLLNDNGEARKHFEMCVTKQKRVVNPIIAFSSDNVWALIKDYKEPYCGLYDEGFERLGCIGCPMAGSHRHEAFERWPQFKALYIRSFTRHLDYRKLMGLPIHPELDTPEKLFAWWMEEITLKKDAIGQIFFDEEDEYAMEMGDW